jgi:regulator of protease activity HflC (stomatin/prohibitin superfamily)
MKLHRTIEGSMGYDGRKSPDTTELTGLAYFLMIAGGVLAFILLIALFNTFVVIRSGYVGVITTFGKVTAEAQPGVSLKVPFVQGVKGMNVQIVKDTQNASASTQDLQVVSTDLALNYNLTPGAVDKVYRTIGPNYEAQVIDPVIQETVKSITSSYNAQDLITSRPAVQAKLLSSLQSALTRYGFTVDNVSILNFDFSAAFSAAIENKQVEAQNVQAAQYKLDQANLNAQANQVQDAALTPAILEQQAIAKWDGRLPSNTVAGGSTLFSIPVSGQ